MHDFGYHFHNGVFLTAEQLKARQKKQIVKGIQTDRFKYASRNK